MEERLKSQVNSLGNVLKHLAVYALQGRTLLFQCRYASLGFVPTRITPFSLPSVLTVGKGVIVQPPTLVKHFAHGGGLGSCGLHPVHKRLSHAHIMPTIAQVYNDHLRTILTSLSHILLGNGRRIPIPKGRGLARLENC